MTESMGLPALRGRASTEAASRELSSEPSSCCSFMASRYRPATEPLLISVGFGSSCASSTTSCGTSASTSGAVPFTASSSLAALCPGGEFSSGSAIAPWLPSLRQGSIASRPCLPRRAISSHRGASRERVFGVARSGRNGNTKHRAPWVVPVTAS